MPDADQKTFKKHLTHEICQRKFGRVKEALCAQSATTCLQPYKICKVCSAILLDDYYAGCPLGLPILKETKHDTLKNLAVSHVRLYMAIVLKCKTVEISRGVVAFSKFHHRRLWLQVVFCIS